jgi:uncharacterized protein YaaN involved in tellurite resistance
VEDNVADNTEDFEEKLANLIPDVPPESEEEQLALQNRLLEISREFEEIAESVEEMTQAMLESFGLTEAELDALTRDSMKEEYKSPATAGLFSFKRH